MSEELKSTQIVYGENVLMMRVDDCLIFGNKNALRSLTEKLTEIPSVEPEQKKGKWIYDGVRGRFPVCKCSICGHYENADWAIMQGANFCPHCGADMRGKND